MINQPVNTLSQDGEGRESEVRQFHTNSIQFSIAITCIGGILIALFGGDWGLSILQVTLYSLMLLVPGLIALAIYSEHFLISIWCLFVDWLVCTLTFVLAFSLHPPFILFAFPIIFSTIFISPFIGVLTWAGTGIFSLLITGSNWGSVVTSDALLFFFTDAVLMGMMWKALHSYLEMTHWSYENYRLGREELDQARDQRGQFTQAIHDLAEANTQMTRLNQLLNAARYQAQEAERVKAEFVANVSHELRTPLNMILGYCELIMDYPAVYGSKLPPKLLADIAAIQRNSQHLTGLINDVLDISQIEAQRMSLRREWTSIRNVLDEAVIAVQPLIESRNLYLKIQLPDQMPHMYIDPTRIRQVLLNLVSNAARVTDLGGISILVEYFDEILKVSVSDTGPGIAPENLQKLFQPFRQLDGGLNRKHGGSGLGLNISRNFVELHGGKIGVSSQVGEGSCFWFTLPVQERPDPRSGFERWLNSDYENRMHPKFANPQPIVPRVVVLEQSSLFYEQASTLSIALDLELARKPEEAVEILNASPCQAIIVRGENEANTREWANKVLDSRFQTTVAACCLAKEDYLRRLEVERYLLKPVDHNQLFDAIKSINKPVRSILLVDDDIETLQLFTRVLSTSDEKYRVLQSTDGGEALKLLSSRKVDLIILDLYMPGMDGFRFLQEKNQEKRWKDIPVIILSAEDPAIHHQAVSELVISRQQGLSIPEVFQFALKISEVLEDSRPLPAQEKIIDLSL